MLNITIPQELIDQSAAAMCPGVYVNPYLFPVMCALAAFGATALIVMIVQRVFIGEIKKTTGELINGSR